MSDPTESKPLAKAGTPRPSSSPAMDTPPQPTSSGKAYGKHVAERVRNPRYSGLLSSPDAVGVGGSLECGSLVTIGLRMEEGVVAGARYQAYGCPATLASAEAVCELVTGATFLDAARVSEEDVRRLLALRPDKAYTATIALDALHAALGSVLEQALAARAEAEPRFGPLLPDRNGVLVGMSGGVDSGFAALRLKEAGFRVAGITLRLWEEDERTGARSCCSLEAVRRARETAHSLGLPHLTVDASAAFRSQVIEYFVAEYAAGRTPNPCLKCNARLRFDLMLRVAHLLGWERIATGHYARLTGERQCLSRGADGKKDQSYVLAEVSPILLRQVLFPLGEMTKEEVRALAVQVGLRHHSAPESQEICFVPAGEHRRFLRERLGQSWGDIVHVDGTLLGRHSGIYNFTVGQRRGVRVAAGRPLYVVALDAEAGSVVVGTKADTAVGAVYLGSLVCHDPDEGGPLTVQLRSTGPALPVERLAVGEVGAVITLRRPAYGVAPGQSAVVYQGSQVALAGTIQRTEPWTSKHGE